VGWETPVLTNDLFNEHKTTRKCSGKLKSSSVLAWDFILRFNPWLEDITKTKRPSNRSLV
jgi:hypothetical protein